ncbi:hypothetical protein [Rummeliibacillus pycnus]|uniref:hypothetical protein n=1 Tax=Rummeliibacillus pycnus TaxID=101070 RepID=UPI000C9AFFC1|nr:hypothetical protein [Rummeliibacillus pycnus]
MSGKKATLIVVGIALVCVILIYLSILAFYKNNPHQPNQKSLSLTLSVTQNEFEIKKRDSTLIR